MIAVGSLCLVVVIQHLHVYRFPQLLRKIEESWCGIAIQLLGSSQLSDMAGAVACVAGALMEEMDELFVGAPVVPQCGLRERHG